MQKFIRSIQPRGLGVGRAGLNEDLPDPHEQSLHTCIESILLPNLRLPLSS